MYVSSNFYFHISIVFVYLSFFFFNATSTTEIYTLSLHDALPIFMVLIKLLPILGTISGKTVKLMVLALICQYHEDRKSGSAGMPRPISYAVFCLKKKKRTRQCSARI